MSHIDLQGMNKIRVHQVHELGEWFGFETRNKYQILDEQEQLLGYAAEQQKGILGFVMRQYFGHWRSFEVHIFNVERKLAYIANHPFRWFFQRIEVHDSQGKMIGAIQRKFSVLTKRFDVEDSRGLVLFEVSSPIWRIWTFSFMAGDLRLAEVRKKWSGVISEAFTDRDNFEVEYVKANMSPIEKSLVMVAAVFIDLMYFERKK